MVSSVQLFKEIEKNKISSVYLLLGEEQGVKDDFITRLKSKIFSGAATEVTQITYFYADEVSVDEIITECATYSFFHSKKMIVVKDVEKLKDILTLSRYVNAPNPDTILILCSTKRAVAKNLQAAVAAQGKASIFWNLFQNQSERWLYKRLLKKGIKAESEAVKYIVTVTGNVTGDLENQISLIENYFERGDVLDLKKVESIVSSVVGYTVFDLTNSIFLKKPAEIIKIFRVLIRNGEELVKLQYFCWLQLVKLLEAYILKREGNSISDVITIMGLKKLEAERIQKRLGYVTLKRLHYLISQLAELDFTIKTTPRLIAVQKFEGFLMDTCVQ